MTIGNAHIQIAALVTRNQARAFLEHLRGACARCVGELLGHPSPPRRLVAITALAGPPATAAAARCMTGNQLFDIVFGRMPVNQWIAMSEHTASCSQCAGWLQRAEAPSRDVAERMVAEAVLRMPMDPQADAMKLDRPSQISARPFGAYRAQIPAQFFEAAQSDAVDKPILLNRFELSDTADRLGCFAFCDLFTDRTVMLTVTEMGAHLKSVAVCGTPARYEGGQWRAAGRVDERCEIVVEIFPESGVSFSRAIPSGIDSTSKTLRAIASGEVQGVHYRAFLQKQARALGVHGWVRNLPDKTVEFVAQGPDGPLQRLLEWAKRGPRDAPGIDIFREPYHGNDVFTDFVVRE